jgi:AraC family transcriptional regulator
VKTDYLPAVQSAIDYIESRLHEDLPIQLVAFNSGFSPFHFHRIFSAVTGESVKDYIRKRRLVLAADSLRNSGASLLELAVHSGFDSQEAFTRAFKRLYGVTPGAYRKGDKTAALVWKPRASEKLLRHLAEGVTMQPKIVERDADIAVGVGNSFTQGDTEKIKGMWMKFVERIPEIRNQKDYSLGVCMSAHPDVALKPGDTFVYVAAMPVSKVEDVPQGMVVCELPKSKYAVFTHKGPISDIRHTVEYIWGTWIPEGHYKIRDIPDFELYDERFDPVTACGEVDIYVPIEG